MATNSYKKKVALDELLELADLGPTRAARELNKRLGARKTEFYKGAPVADCEDNGTRMRATDTLVDVNGLRKTNVKVTGSLELRASDMSPEERKKWLDDNRALLEKFFEGQGWRRPDGDPA